MPPYSIPYTRARCTPCEAFPNRTVTHRPLLRVILTHGSLSHVCYAIVDSGADDCMFPASYAARIGLDLQRGRRYEFSGAGSHSQVAHFFDLRVAIPSVPRPIRFQTQIGFTNALEGAGIGLLGQNGFFDRFRVTFDLPRELFVISPTRRKS